jgi:hypothetical protein
VRQGEPPVLADQLELFPQRRATPVFCLFCVIGGTLLAQYSLHATMYYKHQLGVLCLCSKMACTILLQYFLYGVSVQTRRICLSFEACCVCTVQPDMSILSSLLFRVLCSPVISVLCSPIMSVLCSPIMSVLCKTNTFLLCSTYTPMC